LGLRGQQVEAQVGGPDIVDLFHDEITPPVEALRGAAEGEGHQEAQQTEDRGFDRGKVLEPVCGRQAPAELGDGQHRQE
jgi:hypothetical protein